MNVRRCIITTSFDKNGTVRWRDQVVVLGGQGEDRQVLNDVFMYDCKTGKLTTLPAMLEKRWFCCVKVCMVCSINLDKYFVVFTMFGFLFILSFRPVNLGHRLGIHRCETGYTSPMISLSHATRDEKFFWQVHQFEFQYKYFTKNRFSGQKFFLKKWSL